MLRKIFRSGGAWMRASALVATVLTPLSASAAVSLLSPSQYECFDTTQASTLQTAFSGACTYGSPFATDVNAGNFGGTGGYFYLETFEDGLLNTPGVSGNGSVTGPGGITDSVDADDGTIDGSGVQGRSLFASGNPGITFTFDGGILGALPTHVGIVWTDGAGYNEVTVLIFDSGAQQIGSIVANPVGDGSFASGTAEDRFFGFIADQGIGSLRIYNSVMWGGGSGIEVDHLQYGLMGTSQQVPAPATLALFGLGLAGLGFARRRKQ